MKDTTQNIRCTSEEKAAWKQVAPQGKVSRWLRELANKVAGRDTN